MATAPTHINYFDENWFNKLAKTLGVQIQQFIASYDYPISTIIWKICPSNMFSFINRSIPWKALRLFEIKIFQKTFHLPREMDVWIKKKHRPGKPKIKFIVVYNNYEIVRSCFLSSPYISPIDVITYHNKRNSALPMVFNLMVGEHLDEDVWFAFCHQDFIINEKLESRLKGKDVEEIYGPIGARPSENRLLGMITQADGTKLGSELEDNTPVQTLDEICIIINAEAFRRGLRFDERFRFHFYGSDFCMQASLMGFNVLAMPLECQHKSRTLVGDIASLEYLSSKKMFADRWKKYKPIRTTTTFIV